MVKSFKKAVACLLAVLMVVCAMPFTAFASTAGTVSPDVTLRFSTFYDTAKGYYDNATCGDTVEKAVKNSMLYDAPLTYNYTKTETGGVSGNLVLEASKTQGISDFLEIDPLEEDIEYGVGNFFAVTVTAKNLPSLFTGNISLKYSNNIEPAGVYSKTAKRVTTYYILGESDATGYDKTSIKAREPIAEMSCSNWYPGLNDTALGDLSYIETDADGVDYIACAFIAGSAIDVTRAEDDFTDPETGDMIKAYENEMIGETFVFKIIGEGPINFEVYDPQDTIEPGSFRNNNFCPTKDDAAKIANQTTYALGTGGEGAGKMTFMGMNVNTGEGMTEEECKHANTTTVNAKTETCTEDGYTGDTKCTDCQNIIAYGKTITAPGHTFTTKASTSKATDATCTDAATYYVECDKCTAVSEEDTVAVGKANGHSFTTKASETKASDATCTDAATYYVQCDNCTTISDTVTVPVGKANGHSFTTKASETKATDATCTDAATYYVQCDNCTVVSDTATVSVGKANGHSFTTKASTSKATDATCTDAATYYVQCDNCTTISDTVTVPVGKANGHSFTTKASTSKATDATCTDAATYYVQCDNCTEVSETATVPVGDPTGHSFSEYVSNNDATPVKDGTKTATCDNGCGTTDTVPDKDSATGINVTVDNANDSYGTVTPGYGTENYAFGATVTLTATPLEDCEFVGWEVGGKRVSTEKTYTFKATVDVTVTPVFRPVDAEKMSVIFYDKYQNVVKSYMDVTVADYQAAIAVDGIPNAPVYAGYEFRGWSMSDEDILALAESTTIQGYYFEDTTQGFTVETTADATIQLDEKRGTKETEQKYVNVMFDTKATVTAPGASAWTVDGVTVGYGESYTFFVGSDIKLEPVFDAVEATPTVAMVKAYKISADSHKIMFLASMNIPDGYDLVDHGFVYGKDMNAEDLVLENVGNKGSNATSGNVKKTSADTNPVEQFGISYGITKQEGKACATAYLTFVKNGEFTTIYSGFASYDYQTGKSIITLPGEDD